MTARIDITGKRFGRLSVIKYDSTSECGHARWECVCDCGNHLIAIGNNLHNGHTRSCGCLSIEIATQRFVSIGKKQLKEDHPRFVDLTGKNFGDLMVIDYSHKNDRGQSIWKCKCSCGNIAKIAGYNLTNGHTTSCGHAVFRSGEESPNWQGGLSFMPYCPKFNRDLKQRIRTYFGDQCVVCGKTKHENGCNLSVHHVEYDKQICCNDKRVMFVTLCRRCHPMTNRDRSAWMKIFGQIIDEIYNGKSYYTKEEFKEISTCV